MGRDRALARAVGASAAVLVAGALAAGLAVAPATTAAPDRGTAADTYDTGYSSSGVVVAPTYKTLAIRRCSSYRYNVTTRVTTCLSYRLGTAAVRLYSPSIVQQKSRTGVWVRLPYVWSSSARALVYNHWLYLQLHKAPAPAAPTATPSPTSASPTGSVSPSASESASPSSSSPGPVITASTIPLPAGTGLSPTPTSTIAGEAAAKSTQYSYLGSGGTAPTSPRWDRCLPITWTVDLANATKAGTTAADELARWQQTMDFASRVTGYTFQYVPGGTGKVTIDQTSGNKVPDSAFTATGAKLLITYVSATDPGAYRSTAVSSSTIGYTQIGWTIYGSTYLMVSKASIQLDYSWAATASETDRYNLLFHEFGHALGLGHVSDTSQVMNPVISSQSLFRLGDRTGLWQLAQQPCR